MKVLVSISPQAFLAERIGGDRITVDVLVPPGQSPATYVVNARQMARISDAAVWFRTGVPFENALVPKLADVVSGLRIVDTREGIVLRDMFGGHDHGSEHGEHAHAHEPGGKDPHIWLDPRNASKQAETMTRVLCELDPAGAADFRANLARLQQDLNALHARLSEALKPVAGKTFMVFHPSFGYFADAYGLKQEPIEIQGKTPTARQLAAIIERAREEGVKVIFVQPQFSRKSAQIVAQAVGGAVVPIDPLARDYITNLERMASAVVEGLTGQAERRQ
jgi:zinc transport system substrate-binding protein